MKKKNIKQNLPMYILIQVIIFVVMFVMFSITKESVLINVFHISIALILFMLIIFYLEIKILGKNERINELTTLKNELKDEENKLQKSYEELSSVYEELSATEEELRSQFEELQKSEEALRVSEERYKLAVEGINDIIWELNMKNGKFFISQRWKNITGYSMDEDLNLKGILKYTIHPKDRKVFLQDFKKYLNKETTLYESTFRIKCKSGEYKWIYNRGKAQRNYTGQVITLAGSLTDITERKRIEEKMEYLASYDQLTNLPNKALLLKGLQEAMDNISNNGMDKKIAVMFLDLDNFKKINDTLGHNYGDQLLKVVAGIIELCVGDSKYASRIGGDEFLVFLPCDDNCDNIISLCESMRKMFNNPLEIGSKHVYTSASIGISVFPKDGIDVNALLKNADTAMYKAKNSGKNRYCFFTNNMREEVVRKSEVEKGLRTALENNELQVYYQPQINVNSRKLVGFEALLRWNNKELGWVSPAEFIPIAEETGLIIPIGEWLIKTVFIQYGEWMKKGYIPFTIAINLSVIQIQDKDFGEAVKGIIAETNMVSKYIEFEITETILMESLECSIELLNKFRDLDIKVALDDFGTGYSSFNYLKSLPINTIKIDKSFIDNINLNSSDKDITHGIITLAHKINKEVIAEGVEEEGQVSLLENMECDRIQGYYFSKPLSLEAAEEMLKYIDV